MVRVPVHISTKIFPRFLGGKNKSDNTSGHVKKKILVGCHILVVSGDVVGVKCLLLTSGDVDSQEALQSYLDRNGDLQTVCWLVLRILPSVPLRSDKVFPPAITI